MHSSVAKVVREPGLVIVAFVALAVPFATLAVAADETSGVENAVPGRQLFNDWSCGSCHTLKDAGGSGTFGPALDGNTALTKEIAVERITKGQGGMPDFGSLMTDDEIDTLADYIIATKAQ